MAVHGVPRRLQINNLATVFVHQEHENALEQFLLAVRLDVKISGGKSAEARAAPVRKAVGSRWRRVPRPAIHGVRGAFQHRV